MGDYTPSQGFTDRSLPPEPDRPKPERPPRSRLNDLLGFAKREIEDAEEELNEREFANYCAILIINLTAKHIEENE